METKPKKTIAPRVDMPCQPADVRAHNFDEVATGYTKEMAMQEASRCLQCKKPLCMKGCPVEVPIRDFIAEVARGNFDAAYRIIKTTNSLPAVCGRVCPQEHQCEGKCILNAKGQPIAIGRLERFVADTYIATSACEQVTGTNSCAMPVKGKKVACIGSGPSSLTCAGVCAANGLKVDVFEALHEPGGVLIYGIPSFRLPKNVVATEVDGLRRSGVDFHLNSVGGRTFTVDELRKEYDAVFIGVGAGLPVFLGVPGENLVGVFSANEYLTRVNLGRAYAFPEQDTPAYLGKHVTVFGAGNVAMDAARTAKRLGAENVYIIYRRGMAELPARKEEVEHAEEEGIIFHTLTNPVEILPTDVTDPRDPNYGWVAGIRCVKMELGEPDASGRRSPIVIEGSEFDIPMDCVIMSLGTSPTPLLKATTPGLETQKRGQIIADEHGLTSIEGVYAGGDAVTGAATVILAMGAGKTAAAAIDKYIQEKK